MAMPAPQYERQPTIYVTPEDHHTLSAMVGSGLNAPPGAALLGQELDRALVVDRHELPRSFARLGSKLTYRDLTTGRMRSVQLVLPEDADVDFGRISVLSPVGAALFGLTKGPAISLETEDGRILVLRIVELEASHDDE